MEKNEKNKTTKIYDLTNVVEKSLIEVNNIPVILDIIVAKLYGVETKRINEAVKNNPEKFPYGYVFELTDEQKIKLIENLESKSDKKEEVETFDHLRKIKFSKTNPKAFTEQGLYMLATILKSKQATQTTIAIIETFTKIRKLQQNIKEATAAKTEVDKNAILQKSNELISEILGNNLDINETETSIEINLAVLKFKHTITKKVND